MCLYFAEAFTYPGGYLYILYVQNIVSFFIATVLENRLDFCADQEQENIENCSLSFKKKKSTEKKVTKMCHLFKYKRVDYFQLTL